MNHTVQQLKSQSELWGSWELKISGQEETILQCKKEKKRKEQARSCLLTMNCFGFEKLVLIFNQHLQAQLSPIFLHFTQLLILLPIFPWVDKLIFHCSGKLIKASISIYPPKNLLVPKGKTTHNGWNGRYTMARDTSASWITQHKHQRFRTQQEWAFMPGFFPSPVWALPANNETLSLN